MTHPRVPPPSRPARRRDAAPARWRRRDFATFDDGVPDVENDDGARDPTERARYVIFFPRSHRLLDPPRDARDAEPRRDGAHRRWMSAEPRPRGFARAMGRFVASRGGCDRHRDGGGGGRRAVNFVSSNRVVVVVVVVRRGGGEGRRRTMAVGSPWPSAAASEGWGERGEARAKTKREECGSGGRARRKRGRDEREMRMDARGEASERTDE